MSKGGRPLQNKKEASDQSKSEKSLNLPPLIQPKSDFNENLTVSVPESPIQYSLPKMRFDITEDLNKILES